MKKSKGTKAIEQVALRRGVDVEEVRREIEKAIEARMSNPDPKVQEYWAKIPRKGEKPTPEEVIVYAKRKIVNSPHCQ